MLALLVAASGTAGAPQAMASFRTDQFHMGNDLNGRNGFRINGAQLNSKFGVSAIAGDFNGDGMTDLAFGASELDAVDGPAAMGAVYVLFGNRQGFPATLDVASLDGSNGFRIDGTHQLHRLGLTLSAGDLNGDGLDDLVMTSGFFGESSTVWTPHPGPVYVLYGSRDGFPAVLPAANIDGSNGFRFIDEDSVEAAEVDSTFVATMARDINGDGRADLIIGEPHYDPEGGNDRLGRAHVVYGRGSNFPATLRLADLDGETGFSLAPPDDVRRFGNAVAAVDLNGDGLDDVVIGAPFRADISSDFSGQVYIVYGRSDGFPAMVDTSALDGSNGFVAYGGGYLVGASVGRAGDVDGDGIEDLIIGSPHTNYIGTQRGTGAAYVLLGSDNGYPHMTDGRYYLFGYRDSDFVIVGVDPEGLLGVSVNTAGDLNADGYADVIVSAKAWQVTTSVVVVFGGPQAGLRNWLFASYEPQYWEPDELWLGDGIGLALTSDIPGTDECGAAVGPAGDFNGDGVDDVVVGCPRYPSSDTVLGHAFVLFGGLTGFGEVPVAGVSDEAVDFGDVLLGQASPPRTVTLTNTGYVVDLELGELALDGSGSGAFAISNDLCSNQVLAQDASCTFELTFTPSARGPRTASVHVPSNAPSGPNTVALEGIGTGGPDALFGNGFESDG